MSYRKLPTTCAQDQQSIKSFVKTSFVTEIQERTKQLSLKKKNQERAKPVTTPVTPNPIVGTTIKRKSPPSRDTEEKDTEVAK